MTLEERILALTALGSRIKVKLIEGSMSGTIDSACEANHWFTKDSVAYALNSICTEMLDEAKLREWAESYNIPDNHPAKNIGVIMAGNIPLVGFFDLLCVLITGNTALIKPSSKDSVLIDFMAGRLSNCGFEIMPFDTTEGLNAVIATGGDQANLHFKSSFANIPSVLRADRTSVAILDGKENEEELKKLWYDIFMYFGLGCRNVSRIFIPESYDLGYLANILSERVITHPSYLNEYRQNRALLTMQEKDFIDGGFFTLTEDGSGTAKLSNILVTRYTGTNEVDRWLEDNEPSIQCVVSSDGGHLRGVRFGRSQRPSLSDYPDGVDIIRFLLSLTSS